MDQKFKFLKQELTKTLDNLSKIITEADKLDDVTLKEYEATFNSSIADFKKEVNIIAEQFKKLINIVASEIDKRGIRKLHKHQLSIFDDITALEHKQVQEVHKAIKEPDKKD